MTTIGIKFTDRETLTEVREWLADHPDIEIFNIWIDGTTYYFQYEQES